MHPPQILASGFIIIILIGTILLTTPMASVDGRSVPFVDALFTATSAMCLTGLVVVDTATTYSVFGQMVIMLLIQIGGLGFMTMSTLFALVLKKRISLRERLILQEALNQNSMEGIVRLIRKIIIYSLSIEFVAFVLLTLRWSVDFPFAEAVYFGMFHAISLFNNAGFDLFGGVSGRFSGLALFTNDPIVSIIAMALIILGGIGFIVMSDLMEYKKRKRLLLHTKVVLFTSAVLIVGGAVVIFTFEFTNPATLGPLNGGSKVLASFFHAVSPRSGGVSTLDVGSFRQATQFFLIILMFIGASPGSTGGGIKTTTFAILIGAMIAMVRGKDDIVMFRHRLAKDRIYKAITLTLFALVIVIISAMVLSTTENHQFLMILFEVTSAFGTVGLSMGLTPELSTIGKIIISFLMFLGRLGPLTLAYALNPKKEKELFRYPEGKITIG
ncbi:MULTISPECIES: TrkH family potassium uptake protein [Paenibacillus]|uniref:TrkH family potassium uptake protein n=1 Tax=Paenibacillus residui TaxID=629724 RepID=A0ABW3D4G8_9BACL|nr:TrkH family potassium uptake protein [Paenibacillus sp. 32O-W]